MQQCDEVDGMFDFCMKKATVYSEIVKEHLEETMNDETIQHDMTKAKKLLRGYTLTAQEAEGMNRLVNFFENGLNGVLIDEVQE